MNTIEIKVTSRRCITESESIVICENADYQLKFNFDAEWNSISTKTLRVVYNDKFEEVVFEGDTVTMPQIHSARLARVGVYAGDIATAPLDLICMKSILSDSAVHEEPKDDVYQQILTLLGQIESESGTVSSAMQMVRAELLGEMATLESNCNSKVNAATETIDAHISENEYKANDSVSFTKGFLDGYVTSSTTKVTIRVPLAKSIANISGVTVSALNVTIANSGGYGMSSSTSTATDFLTETTTKDGISATLDKVQNCVFVGITRTKAFVLTNNQNLQCRLGTLTLQFS